MKPSHIFCTIFFPIVSSLATITDCDSSAPKVLKGSNAILEPAIAVHDQAFKHGTTLSNFKRMLDPLNHDNYDTEKYDGVGKLIDETSGQDENGRLITEKRGDFGDFLYKLFGLPDRKRPNGEKHGIENATPERRNDNGRVSSTMRARIGSGDSSKHTDANGQKKRSLLNHIITPCLALEEFERRRLAQVVTEIRNSDNEKREPTVGTLPCSKEQTDRLRQAYIS